MTYIGDFKSGSIVRIEFVLTDGAIATAPSDPITPNDIEIRRNGTLIKSGTGGVTVSSINGTDVLIECNTTDNSDPPAYWGAGYDYSFFFNTSKTVDSKSLNGLFIASVSLENRQQQLATANQLTDAVNAIINEGINNWTTATGFATPVDVSASTANIVSQGGAGPWTTATGFATPVDVSASTNSILSVGGAGPWTTGTGTAPPDTFNAGNIHSFGIALENNVGTLAANSKIRLKRGGSISPEFNAVATPIGHSLLFDSDAVQLSEHERVYYFQTGLTGALGLPMRGDEIIDGEDVFRIVPDSNNAAWSYHGSTQERIKIMVKRDNS